MPPQIKASLQGKVHTRDDQEAAQTRTSSSHLIRTWIKHLTGEWNKATVLLILLWSWTGPYSIPILAQIFSCIKEDTVLPFKGDLNTDLRDMVSMHVVLGLSPNNNKLVSATRV